MASHRISTWLPTDTKILRHRSSSDAEAINDSADQVNAEQMHIFNTVCYDPLFVLSKRTSHKLNFTQINTPCQVRKEGTVSSARA